MYKTLQLQKLSVSTSSDWRGHVHRFHMSRCGRMWTRWVNVEHVEKIWEVDHLKNGFVSDLETGGVFFGDRRKIGESTWTILRDMGHKVDQSSIPRDPGSMPLPFAGWWKDCVHWRCCGTSMPQIPTVCSNPLRKLQSSYFLQYFEYCTSLARFLCFLVYWCSLHSDINLFPENL